MNRISTAATYNSALLNILSAQNRQTEAQNQVSTGKIATDLKGYGTKADALTGARSLKARIDSHLENAKTLSSTLTIQDQALNQLSKATQGARNAIAEAVANGNAAGLIETLKGKLGEAADALNTQFQGRYLFAGAETGTRPFTANDLTDLTAAPTIASLFGNDAIKQVDRLDDNLTVETGFLASDLATPIMTALKAVETFNAGGSGPLVGQMNQTQSDALTAMLASFDAAFDTVNNAVARNGELQNRVDSITGALTDRQTALKGMISDMSDVDMAEAVSRLQLAQVALQASSQVFATLNNSSLLDVLSR
jgi:flagellar hook-associated protein 3 FlgL